VRCGQDSGSSGIWLPGGAEASMKAGTVRLSGVLWLFLVCWLG